jgi:peroxiredoxin
MADGETEEDARMESLGRGRPVQVGMPAPDFALAMVDGDRPGSLGDYRGKDGLLLNLFRGICAPGTSPWDGS